MFGLYHKRLYNDSLVQQFSPNCKTRITVQNPRNSLSKSNISCKFTASSLINCPRKNRGFYMSKTRSIITLVYQLVHI